jgi:uncharacterized protein YndB with AHSA1/START domain
METIVTTDRIEKMIQLDAPRSRVWRALTDMRQFGEWFACKFSGSAVPGATLSGRITIPKYEHITLEIKIETVQPESRFSFRWHPFAIETGVDYSKEPMTLVLFTLEEVAGGTLLTVVESGFENIPASRRVKAFEMNSGGWAEQMQNIKNYLTGSA